MEIKSFVDHLFRCCCSWRQRGRSTNDRSRQSDEDESRRKPTTTTERRRDSEFLPPVTRRALRTHLDYSTNVSSPQTEPTNPRVFRSEGEISSPHHRRGDLRVFLDARRVLPEDA